MGPYFRTRGSYLEATSGLNDQSSELVFFGIRALFGGIYRLTTNCTYQTNTIKTTLLKGPTSGRYAQVKSSNLGSRVSHYICIHMHRFASHIYI